MEMSRSSEIMGGVTFSLCRVGKGGTWDRYRLLFFVAILWGKDLGGCHGPFMSTMLHLLNSSEKITD